MSIYRILCILVFLPLCFGSNVVNDVSSNVFVINTDGSQYPFDLGSTLDVKTGSLVTDGANFLTEITDNVDGSLKILAEQNRVDCQWNVLQERVGSFLDLRIEGDGMYNNKLDSHLMKLLPEVVVVVEYTDILLGDKYFVFPDQLAMSLGKLDESAYMDWQQLKAHLGYDDSRDFIMINGQKVKQFTEYMISPGSIPYVRPVYNETLTFNVLRLPVGSYDVTVHYLVTEPQRCYGEQEHYYHREELQDVEIGEMQIIESIYVNPQNNLGFDATYGYILDDEHNIVSRIKPWETNIIRNGKAMQMTGKDIYYVLEAADKIQRFSTSKELEEFIDVIRDNARTTYISIETYLDEEKVDMQTTSQEDRYVYASFMKGVNPEQLHRNFKSYREFSWIDPDPILGWPYDRNVTVIVIGQLDSIMFHDENYLWNQGDMIVTFREDTCEPFEQKVFGFSDPHGGKVYQHHETDYVTCVSSFERELDVKTLSAQSSFGTKSISPVDIAEHVHIKDKQEDVFADIIMSDTVVPGYSCLGAYDKQKKIYGDCSMDGEKMWIRLGEDTKAPKSTVSYSLIENGVKITLDAQDDQSEIETIYYCTGRDICGGFTAYTEPIEFECGDHERCSEFSIYFHAEDTQGNKEVLQKQVLDIPNIYGCTEQCTLGNSERINKFCYDQGACELDQDILEACHLHNNKAQVEYNETYHVSCSSGLKSRKAFFKTLEVNEDCKEFVTESKDVLIHGEVYEILMHNCLY